MVSEFRSLVGNLGRRDPAGNSCLVALLPPGRSTSLPEKAAQQQGVQQGLQLRFGEVLSNLETSLQGLSVEQLEELMEVALTSDHVP